MTDLDLEQITKDVARIVEAFDDDWQIVDDDGEASVRTSDSAEGNFTEIFATSQRMGTDEDGPSPLAAWLASTPVLIPRLIAEIERLRAEHSAAVRAMLSAELQLSSFGDVGAAWERLGDYHKAHGWVDPSEPCQPCTDLYGGA